jgi:hypothetical protein
MQCAGDSEIRALAVEAWRVVEAQHRVSTRKLVGTNAEQTLLEQMLERSKPPLRTDRELHYLLSTPVRYPPLRHGSRFGTRFEPSLWYGSEELRTAFSEVAHYRWLFLDGTRAELGSVETQLTAFSVPVETERGVDLTMAPFAAHGVPRCGRPRSRRFATSRPVMSMGV